MLAGTSRAAFTPIAIQSSSYNADVIVESNAGPRLVLATSASIDQGSNNFAATLFEVGFDTNHPANGVPLHGSTIVALSNANYSFTMPPDYTKPNGILIDTLVTTGAFHVVSPAAYTKLSFLCLGGNGGDGVSVQVQHLDGSSEPGSFNVPDWFGGPQVAVVMNGRLSQVAQLNPETDGASGDGVGNPRIYYRDITLANTASPVTNIVFTYASGQASSHNDIMAVSGALTSGSGAVTPITVTGYDYDFIVETNAAHQGNVTSQVLDPSGSGTNLWATTQSIDATNNTGSTWYEMGFNLNNNGQTGGGTPVNNPADNLTGTGIPHANSYLTNATGDHIYQMPADYTTNDAIYISSLITNATITLANPTAFTALSFLGSAGNGPVTVNLVIHHQGGATETPTLTINDWFNGSVPYALIANGRVDVGNATFSAVQGNNPRLLQNDITLSDVTDPIISIDLINTNIDSGRFAILAMSGSAGAYPPIIAPQPTSTNVYFATAATFTSGASANAAITYQWQKGTNGMFVNLTDGGNISGSTTTNLTINPAGFTDQADYRIIATNIAGASISSAATLQVFSTNLDVTQPGDPISAGSNVSPFGDGPPSHAINDDMSTKFGANFTGGTVPYLVVSPAAGVTIVSALRIYTGNDSTGRDPASYKLEGSTDGGAHYALISSNAISLSDNRNSGLASGTLPNPLTQVVTEVRFANTNGYTTYRVSFPTQKGGVGNTQIQFQEMELLGVVTTNLFFSTQPFDAVAYAGPTTSAYGSDSATFTAVAVASPTPTISWFKGTNGVYVPLSDTGNITGSQTTTLSINPTTFADAADYVAIANSGSQYATSSIAHLFIYSTNMDVTQPGDTITEFGDTTGTRYGANANPVQAIDDLLTEWQNGGSGPSAGAGFPPFYGPVGLIVTPAVGSTVLAGLRVYAGADPQQFDPNGYILEGSNDGGSTYTPIASGPLSLPAGPAGRNTTAYAADPAYQVSSGVYVAVQEILFSNTRGFTTYRLTFPSVVNTNTADHLTIGEVELLGVSGTGVVQPVITHTTLSGGSLHISGAGGTPLASFTVQTNANLTLPAGWNTAATGSYDSSGNFSVSLPVSPTTPQLFYRIH